MTESVLKPAFDRDILARQKQLLRLERGLFHGWEQLAEETVDPVLFGGFPYSMQAWGTETSIQNITPDSLNEWYERRVKNRKPVVVIVGDTEGTSLASYFVRDFSGSRFQTAEISDDFAKPLEGREAIETTRDGRMSLVSVVFQAPPVGDYDCHAVEVLQSYFGEMGKMYGEIREKMGMAYKIGVLYEPRLRGGSFLTYAVTNPDTEEAVLDAFEREFRRIVDSPIAFRDLRSAVNTAVGNFLVRRQIPLVQIMDVSRNALAGGGIEAYRSYETKLQSVYEEDLKEAAERFLMTNNAVFLRIHGSGSLNIEGSKAE